MKKDWIIGKIKTASQNYTCDICGSTINKGDKYDSHFHYKYLYDDSRFPYDKEWVADHYHLDCELPEDSMFGEEFNDLRL